MNCSGSFLIAYYIWLLSSISMLTMFLDLILLFVLSSSRTIRLMRHRPGNSPRNYICEQYVFNSQVHMPSAEAMAPKLEQCYLAMVSCIAVYLLMAALS